jgi:hypothetical protein
MGNVCRPKRGALHAAGVLLMLSACTPPQTAPNAVQPPPMDPILNAAATRGPGAALSVATPNGPVTVTVTSDYASAEGNECRAYTTTTAGAQAAHLACNQGSTWREIPPLAPADNESGLP